MSNNYQPGVYNDAETQRRRWAVFCGTTHIWYFAKRYGEAAARALASRMNSEVQP